MQIASHMYLHHINPFICKCSGLYRTFIMCSTQSFLYASSKLWHIILPEAWQQRTFGLGCKKSSGENGEKWRNGRHPRGYENSTSWAYKRVLVFASQGHPHAASPWLKPAVPWLGSALSVSSCFFCSWWLLRKKKNLQILMFELHSLQMWNI